MSTTLKRTRRGLLAMAPALVIGATVAAEQAEAARGWCKADPLILIDGQLADVFVGSTLEMLLSATGPIKMEITIPSDSKGSVVLTDVGFLRGYSITFKKSSTLVKTRTHTQVQVSVFAPSKSSLPVTVTFAPRSLNSSLTDILFGRSVDGSSNSWVTLKTS